MVAALISLLRAWTKISNVGENGSPLSERSGYLHLQIKTRQWVLYRGALSENLNRTKSEMFEEIGVETDEDSKCNLEELSRLTSNKRRRLK